LVKKNLLITGLPGVGKTILIKKLSEALKYLHPVGFYTAEIRERGERKGFELSSLEGKKSLLSHKDIKSSYKVVNTRWTSKVLRSFLTQFPFSIHSPVSLSSMRSERWNVSRINSKES
jgi:nucleoside-triphosphatase THEP1